MKFFFKKHKKSNKTKKNLTQSSGDDASKALCVALLIEDMPTRTYYVDNIKSGQLDEPFTNKHCFKLSCKLFSPTNPNTIRNLQSEFRKLRGYKAHLLLLNVPEAKVIEAAEKGKFSSTVIDSIYGDFVDVKPSVEKIMANQPEDHLEGYGL